MTDRLTLTRAAEDAVRRRRRAAHDVDDLYATVNVYPDHSGLPMTVWVRPRSNERHQIATFVALLRRPRVEVCRVHGSRMFPRDTVLVTLPPIRVIPPDGLPAAELSVVSDWIRLNEAALAAFWKTRIPAVEFGRQLQKLP